MTDDEIPPHVYAFEDDATHSGIVLIVRERQRQLTEEGWTHEHDAKHEQGELAFAAAVYAIPRRSRDMFDIVRTLWPFGRERYRPAPTASTDDRIRELAKAGALIAAEIDRLKRSV